ncbi:MAG: hypothetical protein RDV48_05525 [Candidatus Eremiobacteraeota bacterium]|nr:hypothetical protein [Candidatus Eremiobacteraeota bacterium]
MEDYAYNWGCEGELYFYMGRKLPTKHVVMDRLYYLSRSSYTGRPSFLKGFVAASLKEYGEDLLRSLSASPPSFIIVSSPSPDFSATDYTRGIAEDLEKFISDRYELSGTRERIRIYRLKKSSPSMRRSEFLCQFKDAP